MLLPLLAQIASILGVTGSLLWIAQLVHSLTHNPPQLKLRDLPDTEPEDGWPPLSVIVAARDEEAMIESSVRSLLAQDYPELEIVVVDDRSADRTGPILDELAAHHHRLRVIHVTEVPSGWLGKTNALQRGAEGTLARWLLFTDADVLFAPGALKRAISLTDRESLDHLTLMPDVITKGIGEPLFVSLFNLLFTFKSPYPWIEKHGRQASIGVGAFNLVRTEVFENISGFKRVALSIDEDMRLGQAIKFAGYRPKCVQGTSDVSVRWQIGLGGMVRGVEKNFFAGLDFRLRMVALATFVTFLLCWAPWIGLFVGPLWTRIICGIGIIAVSCLLPRVTASASVPWYYALLLPISGPVMVVAIWRSTWLTLKNDGVNWRGHHYPLAELRKHIKLRNYWLNEVWFSTR
jgi:glycosyltransferase involved in cell wall biosynthesis